MLNRNLRDVIGGLLMMGIGLFFALYGSSQYSFGTAARMGPGFFPVVLGWILAILGLLIVLPALRQPRVPMQFALSNFLWVFVALGTFAWGLPRLGLVLAAFVGAFISSMADKEVTWLSRVLISIGVSVVSVLIFKYGLAMVLPLWWWED